MRTIHNGVPDLGPPGESPLGRHTIGTVGRLEPQKGYDVLLSALVSLPDTSLRMVGDGASRAELLR